MSNPQTGIRHGTSTAYVKRRCRCPECRAWQSERLARQRSRPIRRAPEAALTRDRPPQRSSVAAGSPAIRAAASRPGATSEDPLKGGVLYVSTSQHSGPCHHDLALPADAVPPLEVICPEHGLVTVLGGSQLPASRLEPWVVPAQLAQ
jgi:hypothetical protein